MIARPAQAADFENWQRVRRKLWERLTDAENREFFDEHLRGGDRNFILLAESEPGEIAGFLEAGIRTDYVESCRTNRVGYIEGWFVEAEFRRQRVGRLLVAAAEDWARLRGCAEMASDCDLENETSLAAHLGVGYEEVGRNIHFKKNL